MNQKVLLPQQSQSMLTANPKAGASPWETIPTSLSLNSAQAFNYQKKKVLRLV
jgi:hypothetical protein